MCVDTTVGEWFAKRSRRRVDIVLAGHVFGGRRGESPQEVRDFSWDGTTLFIRFGTTEELEVLEPHNVYIGSHEDLTTTDATRVRWAWHYYGRPQTSDSRCEEVLVPHGEEVNVTRPGPSVPRLPRKERQPRRGQPLAFLSDACRTCRTCSRRHWSLVASSPAQPRLHRVASHHRGASRWPNEIRPRGRIGATRGLDLQHFAPDFAAFSGGHKGVRFPHSTVFLRSFNGLCLSAVRGGEFGGEFRRFTESVTRPSSTSLDSARRMGVCGAAAVSGQGEAPPVQEPNACAHRKRSMVSGCRSIRSPRDSMPRACRRGREGARVVVSRLLLR